MRAVLEVEGVSKTFTRTKALAGVSMTIEPGEVHALLGQNGSGKSTLIKILSGYHAPDPGGGIRVEGNELPLQSPVQSYRLGMPVRPTGPGARLDVVRPRQHGARLRLSKSFGTINGKATYKQAENDLERLSLDINPKALVATLSAWERTGVAIARALREDPDYPACLLVLDEPTATLPVDEVDNLLDRVSAMAGTGVGVLYVTHHLGEVFRVAHQVSVFRDGRVVRGRPRQGVRPCRSLTARRRRVVHGGEASPGAEGWAGRMLVEPSRFEVKDLGAGALAGVSFGVERGEIVGIAGWRDRAGTTSSARASARLRARGASDSRGWAAAGRPSRCRHRPRRRVLGAGPESRRRRDDDERPRESDSAGAEAVLEGRASAPRSEQARTKEWFERLSVRPAHGVNEPLGIFSGGNQQKILFGKWLSQKPSVFLLDEPNQGVDVGAKADLHRELLTAAQNGAAVIVGSSDLEELADLCDRVIVIVDGQVSAPLVGAALTTETSPAGSCRWPPCRPRRPARTAASRTSGPMGKVIGRFDPTPSRTPEECERHYTGGPRSAWPRIS